jgi:hypothetical protein
MEQSSHRSIWSASGGIFSIVTRLQVSSPTTPISTITHRLANKEVNQDKDHKEASQMISLVQELAQALHIQQQEDHKPKLLHSEVEQLVQVAHTPLAHQAINHQAQPPEETTQLLELQLAQTTHHQQAQPDTLHQAHLNTQAPKALTLAPELPHHHQTCHHQLTSLHRPSHHNPTRHTQPLELPKRRPEITYHQDEDKLM